MSHKYGGKKLLNIRVNNEAIELMKAQNYLKIGQDYPKQAIIADKIISTKITKKKAGNSLKLNLFL